MTEKLHISWGPGAADMSPEQLAGAEAEILASARKMRDERETAAKALEGLPYAAVPLDQLADIYKRFLRLTRLGQGTIDEWNARSEEECEVRHAVFRQADFGAVYAGQWLPKELRDEVRNLVKGKNYEYQFDHHQVAYHRDRMDQLTAVSIRKRGDEL